jgi:hypothetical protein
MGIKNRMTAAWFSKRAMIQQFMDGQGELLDIVQQGDCPSVVANFLTSNAGIVPELSAAAEYKLVASDEPDIKHLVLAGKVTDEGRQYAAAHGIVPECQVFLACVSNRNDVEEAAAEFSRRSGQERYPLEERYFVDLAADEPLTDAMQAATEEAWNVRGSVPATQDDHVMGRPVWPVRRRKPVPWGS